MRLSLGTRLAFDKISDRNGYGYATSCMISSLERLGYHIEANDSSADVEIWFDQPHHWKLSKTAYNIGYHPWESTQLLPGWAEIMNKCDEIWTPSPLIAQWYREFNGVTVPIYVYEHGIEHVWQPRRRKVDGPVKFLHVGGEAARKGAWDLPGAIREACGAQHIDAELTLKMNKSSWNGVPRLGMTTYLNKSMPFSQLQDLFYDHHVYVYPSRGEGFGLTPLQAMATGMPTITLPGWAPYKQFMDPNLSLSHVMAKTNWPEIHPGYMMRPSMDDIIKTMRYAATYYDECVDFALEQAEKIHEYYDWDRLTKQAFEALESRLNL